MTSYIKVSDTGSVLELINQKDLGEDYYVNLTEVEAPEGIADDLSGWTYIDGVFNYTLVESTEVSQADLIKSLQDDIAVLKAALNV